MKLDILLENLSIEENGRIPQFMLISAFLWEQVSKSLKKMNQKNQL